MTLCDVMSCSMPDVYRCFVRLPCVMWCHAVWHMYRCFVRWPCVMWHHAVWQMCTEVSWDDPVWCDTMQYGRCVQMFRKMTLWCDVMQYGRCVQISCKMTLCDVSCSMADVYRCLVRARCMVEVAHCSRFKSSVLLHITPQQHLWEPCSSQALCHSPWLGH